MSERVNWDLFGRVVEAIEARPGQHNQGSYHCGTSHCFAGWAELLSMQEKGVLPVPAAEYHVLNWRAFWHLQQQCGLDAASTHKNAQKILGLSDGQADYLFDEHRELADFQQALITKDIGGWGH